MNDDFIYALDRLLKSKKMTYADLADAIGTSRSTVSMWKTGKSAPRMDTLEKIANLFNIQVSDLLKNKSDESHIGVLRLQLAEMKNLKEHISNATYYDDESRARSIERIDSWIQEQENFIRACENYGPQKTLSSVTMLDLLEQLNNTGQEKAIEHVEMLTKIPEYRKEE